MEHQVSNFSYVFIVSFEQKSDVYYEEEFFWTRLEKYLVSTQSKFFSAISKMNNQLQARFENEEWKGSGWVFYEIISMLLEIYKRNL